MDALGHDYQVDQVIEPTCTEGGKTIYKCSRCGDSYEADYTEPLGHDMGEWVVTTEPTCTEQGEETRTCTRCDYFETRPVDALGHDYQVDQVIEPTCTEGGKTIYKCSRCGDSYEDDYTDPLGHAWGEPAYEWSADNSSVTATVVCTNDSSHVVTETVTTEYEVITEPTTSAPGLGRYTATFTNELFTTQEKDVNIPKLPDLSLVEALKVNSEMIIAYGISLSEVQGFASYYIEFKLTDIDGSIITICYGEGKDEDLTIVNNARALMEYRGILAAEMGLHYTAQVHAFDADGVEYVGPMSEGSIKDYLAGRLLNEGTPVKAKTLFADMLNYGAAAQLFFKVDTDHLVNTSEDGILEAAIAQYQTNGVPTSDQTISHAGNEQAPKMMYAVNLRYRVETTFRGNFTADTAPRLIVRDHTTHELVAELPTTAANNAGTAWLGKFNDVAASKMRTLYDFVMVDGSDNELTQTMTWSVAAFVMEKQNAAGTSETMKNVLNAMLIYGDSLANYIGAANPEQPG